MAADERIGLQEAQVFFREERLPNQVFRQPRGMSFGFRDDTAVEDPDFGISLWAVASATGNGRIHIRSIRSDAAPPMPMLTAEPSDLVSAYRHWITGGRHPLVADTFHGSDVVRAWDDSGRWGLWCEPGGEYSILAVPEDRREAVDRSMLEAGAGWSWAWLDPSDPLDVLGEMHVEDVPELRPYVEALLRNYAKRDSIGR